MNVCARKWFVTHIEVFNYLFQKYLLYLFHRFTFKLGIAGPETVNEQEPKLATFLESNMASSISSTVSTRGTTLNKLMIGITFSLG